MVWVAGFCGAGGWSTFLTSEAGEFMASFSGGPRLESLRAGIGRCGSLGSTDCPGNMGGKDSGVYLEKFPDGARGCTRGRLVEETMFGITIC